MSKLCRFKKPVKRGYNQCAGCREKVISRTKDRTSSGLCRCGRKTSDGFRMCEQCRASYRERRHTRKSEGKCQVCGVKQARPDLTTCDTCSGHQKNYKGQNRKKGLCSCGRKPATGKKRCRRCIDAVAKIQTENRKKGLCTCGRERVNGYTKCARCRSYY